MKVMVTGASGFIAGHVIAKLVAAGSQVIAFDRRGLTETVARLPGVSPFLGDTRDRTAVAEAVALSDGVIHLAGVLGTSETINDPWPSVETNVIGGLNVFQAIRQYGVKGVYITVGNYWFTNSYSITKTTAEQLAWMFNREHGTRIAVVRALNAYGPGQKAAPVRKIIPNFILPALRGDPITVYGDGLQVMDMIYVEDVADILVRALVVEHGQYISDPKRNQDNPVKFEAGTGRHTTVNDIAQEVVRQIAQATGRATSVNHVPMRAGEPTQSIVVGNPDTLRPLYGEVPELTTLEAGIAKTIAWYRDHS